MTSSQSPTEAAVLAFRSTITYPPELPITDRRAELVDAIANNQVVIVAGETGSGKSTQLPKLCMEAGRGANGLIGHTQPRRLAARSIAERISSETDTDVGDFVGFSVRFNDRVGPRTVIRLMTDGILLNELQRDRRLSRYDTIIIDEAHERSLNIDFILGYLRQLLPRRPDLHVVVTSATIDVERFSQHFDNAPIIEVSGRTYPVEIRYRPYDDDNGSGPDDRFGLSQPEAIADAVKTLVREGPGDILVFLAGERDIRETADALSDLKLASTEIFPLYARLSSAEQHRVFRPHSGRRIVLATNVAETSVTVPGIRYVIDPGKARISRYNTRTKVQRLPIEDISQASANQRAGRCGRIGPGICVRLYSEDDFDTRDEFTEPEILRTNLASVILQMAALGLGDIASFPFVEPPDDRGIADGVALLEELDALDPDHHGTDQWLTPLGRELARLPVDPRFARMIIEAADNGALAEVLIIVAALSIQDPRERPTDREAEAAEAHRRFNHPTSDFITLVTLWRHLQRQRDDLSGNQFRRMCRREFLNYNRVREWEDTRSQLERTAKDLGYRPSGNRAKVDVIHRCLLSGLLSHIGMKLDEAKGDKGRNRRDRRGRQDRQAGPAWYQGARGSRFRLGRESVVTSQPPAWVMAAELIETNQMWARMAAPIDPAWAEALGPYLVKRSYSDPTWVAADGVAYTIERVTLYGLPVVDDRRRTVGRVDPVLGRELFIHHALVEGDWESRHDFVEHNRDLRAEMAELETRARRDLVVEQQALHAFFDERLPDDITSAAHFDRWWKTERTTHPDLLRLSPDDVIRPDGPAVGVDDFPNRWVDGTLDLELAYVHDGDSPIDGLSVHIPVEVLNQVEGARFEWSVPGLRPALVTHLIRSLPKNVRRALNPVAETVEIIGPELAAQARRRPLTTALADVLGPRAATVIEPGDFHWDRVPAHLTPTFRILGDDRRLLAEGKDLDALRELLSEHTREAIAEISSEQSDLLRSGITRWDFGDLPMTTTTEGPSHTITAYPALIDQGDSVDIGLLPDPNEQADAMWLGTRRLLRLGLPKPVRTLDRLLDNQLKLAMTASPVQSRAAWYNDTIDAVLDHLISESGGPSWTGAGFERLQAAVDEHYDEELRAVLDTVGDLVEATNRVHRRLDATAATPAMAASVTDARAHVDRLAYPGFIAGVGLARLADVVRYLDAIDYRLARLPENPALDVTRAAEVVAVENRHRALVEQMGMTVALEEVLWQLEELRVAMFAQHLRPSVPGAKVSVRRVERALNDAARGASA